MGIPDDLIQDIAIRELAFGAGTLHAAVASYVQSPCYYRALIAGGARYNLNGQPCGGSDTTGTERGRDPFNDAE
ncbi:ProQ/FINO family protein [Escherichia coli]|nr:ProQ/FINO family protein [Escherichia coli]